MIKLPSGWPWALGCVLGASWCFQTSVWGLVQRSSLYIHIYIYVLTSIFVQWVVEAMPRREMLQNLPRPCPGVLNVLHYLFMITLPTDYIDYNAIPSPQTDDHILTIFLPIFLSCHRQNQRPFFTIFFTIFSLIFFIHWERRSISKSDDHILTSFSPIFYHVCLHHPDGLG